MEYIKNLLGNTPTAKSMYYEKEPVLIGIIKSAIEFGKKADMHDIYMRSIVKFDLDAKKITILDKKHCNITDDFTTQTAIMVCEDIKKEYQRLFSGYKDIDFICKVQEKEYVKHYHYTSTPSAGYYTVTTQHYVALNMIPIG